CVSGGRPTPTPPPFPYPTLFRSAAAGGGVYELAGDAFDGRPLGPGVTRGHQPAQGQGLGAARQHLDGHLVGGPADAAAAHLDARADVVEGLPDDLQRLLARAFLDQAAGAVEDAAGEVLLPVAHQLVDERGDGRVGVDEVGLEPADLCASAASHGYLAPAFGFLVPYFERPLLRCTYRPMPTPWASSAPRTMW